MCAKNFPPFSFFQCFSLSTFAVAADLLTFFQGGLFLLLLFHISVIPSTLSFPITSKDLGAISDCQIAREMALLPLLKELSSSFSPFSVFFFLLRSDWKKTVEERKRKKKMRMVM